MKLDPKKLTKTIWFNEKIEQWNWVLIYGEGDDTEMHSGNALDKNQAKHDIIKTMQWIEEKMNEII